MGTGLCYRLIGIRAEESFKRSKREQFGYVQTLKSFAFMPIFDWAEWHVWEFIEKHGLPYLDLYDEGWNRVGCMVCPELSYAQKMRNKERWPGVFKAFEHSVTYWFYNKRINRIEKNPEEYLDNWYHNYQGSPLFSPNQNPEGGGFDLPLD